MAACGLQLASLQSEFVSGNRRIFSAFRLALDRASGKLPLVITPALVTMEMPSRPKAPCKLGGCWIKPIGAAVIAALVTGALHVVDWSSRSPRIAIPQVTEDINDTVNGLFLPVPQSTRLIAKHDSHITCG